MRFVLILAALLCAPVIIAYAEIQQDVVERDTIGGTGGGGGGDLSAIDIDTFSELDAIVADEGLVNLNDAQTLMNKVIDGNSNTVKILRHATDCTAYTGAVDGQYCWEQDDDVLYVCETADECDTAGEWDAVASAGDYLPLSGGTMTGKFVERVQTITFPDSGDGTSPQDTTTEITGNILRVDCQDADGCELTLSETNAGNGQHVKIENVSANTLVLINSSGVAETCDSADYALDTTSKSTMYEYSTNVWKQNCTATIGFQTQPNSCDPGQFQIGQSKNGDATCDLVSGPDIAFDGENNGYDSSVTDVETALIAITTTEETEPNGATSFIPWPVLTGVPEFSIPTGTNPTVDGDPVNLAWDSTAQQLIGYGGASEIVVSTGGIETQCVVVESIKAADDNMPIASWPYAVTITEVWCQYAGSAPTTPATFTLEDGDGNAMTITDTNPTCTAPTTEPTPKAVTAANALVAYEMVRFDTSNTPDPVTDTYMLCVSYTTGRQ